MMLEAPVSRSHGGGWEAARERGLHPRDFIDFSSSVNPWAPPPGVREAVLGNLAEIARYPDPECRELKDALSTYLGVPPECVLPGNGASDLLFSVIRYLHPARGAVPRPSFCEYELALRAVGADIRSFHLPEERAFRPDEGEALELARDSEVTVVAEPNNPTGNRAFSGMWEELAQAARSGGGFLLVDEAFLDFHPERVQRSLAERASVTPGLAALGSLTKFFGLAGLRLGYLVARPEFIRGLAACSPPWSVSALAQAAGVSALADKEFIERSRRLVAEERETLVAQLERIPGLKTFPSSANFLLVRLPSAISSSTLSGLLLEHRVLVRDCSSFPGLEGDFIRVAVRKPAENRALIEALREALR